MVGLGVGPHPALRASHSAFLQRYGAVTTIAGTFAGDLDNSGEQIELVDPNGEVVLDFRYENSWFPPTDGTLVVRRNRATV